MVAGNSSCESDALVLVSGIRALSLEFWINPATLMSLKALHRRGLIGIKRAKTQAWLLAKDLSLMVSVHTASTSTHTLI